MSDWTTRIDRARDAVGMATTRVHELAARMPEPVASVAAAIRSLTAAQREALWNNRTAAMALVTQHATEVRAQLAHLTAQSDMLMGEFEQAQARGDFDQCAEIAAWFSDHDEEVGQLKTLVQELEALHGEFEANPTMPAGLPR